MVSAVEVRGQEEEVVVVDLLQGLLQVREVGGQRALPPVPVRRRGLGSRTASRVWTTVPSGSQLEEHAPSLGVRDSFEEI